MSQNNPERLEAKFGLPEEVRFCNRCVVSNQRPTSVPEFSHTLDLQHPTINFDGEGICDACRFNQRKEDNIDWEEREKELLRLLEIHRRDDGEYNCIVPGSGGKDSCYAAHVLKYKYGMHPLTVTWPPFLYTEVGLQNFRSWIDIGGFDNISYRPNGRVHKLLTRLSTENLLHPFQTFILGQKNLAPKIALKYGIPLIFYGEPGAEYGHYNEGAHSPISDDSFFTMSDLSEIQLGGVEASQLIKDHGLTLNDLSIYLPPEHDDLARSNIQMHYLGYYLKWTPQEAYYYAVEHTGFQARPFRSEGTYSKYNSIDDKIDDLHYYTTWIKFGMGRATYDASQEIRNRHLTRDEGVTLVERFDGEFPDRYFDEVMDYIGLNRERFLELCDQFRSPHLWKFSNSEWKLRNLVS